MSRNACNNKNGRNEKTFVNNLVYLNKKKKKKVKLTIFKRKKKDPLQGGNYENEKVAKFAIVMQLEAEGIEDRMGSTADQLSQLVSIGLTCGRSWVKILTRPTLRVFN